MILKKIYRTLIIPYTVMLLYFMFLGFGRTQMNINIVRLKPLASTIDFVSKSLFWKDIIINLVGNIVMFIPFGFLGWVFPKLNHYKALIINFVFVLIIVESMQYFTRLGVFDIDDILLNSIGVSIGFYIKQKLEKLFKIDTFKN